MLKAMENAINYQLL